MPTTPLSANKWPVLYTAPPAITVPGTGVRLRVRPGAVAIVLIEVARRFHEEVESLEMPGPKDEWGWAFRPIRGQQSGYSNHASGTAIDLNATRHPRKAKQTFTPEQIGKVRRILAAMQDKDTERRVVRWGEDYHTTVDGMHFEIDAGEAAVGRVAARILQKREEARQAALDAATGKTKPPVKPIVVTPPVTDLGGAAVIVQGPNGLSQGVDMFIARVPGDVDKRVFLVTGDGKRLITDPQVLLDLIRICKVPDVGDVPSKTLSFFPTIPADVTATVRKV